MYFSGKDFKKYTIFVLFFIWLILLAHLFYVYIGKIGSEKAVKGGVIIESIIKNNTGTMINPIPYLGNNYYSKYVQSLLFRGCLNSLNQEDLCSIKTNDNKKFIISLSGDNYWNDGRKITLDDIYFTYNDIVYKNSLGLDNFIVNNITNIEKENNKVIVTFKEATVNNLSFFKNYILPKHKFLGQKKEYIANILSDFVNSTCVRLDLKSDYINNVILDYSNCKDYYINKYQIKLLNNIKQVSNFLTGENKIDLYSWYENIDPKNFTGFKVRLNKRYVFFYNTKRQKDKELKVYLSKLILSKLKNNVNISERIDFNGYGLFNLPNIKITKEKILNNIGADILDKKKQEFEDKFVKVNNTLNYKEGENKEYYIKSKLTKNLLIKGTLSTGGYDKLSISANGNKEYFPRSYNGKSFKYIVSEKFKNIKVGKNIYSIYGYKGDEKKHIDDIIIYYQKLEYPKFEKDIPDFVILYLNKGIIKLIGDEIYNTIKEVYPGNVVAKPVSKKDYINILSGGNYDLVVSDINFEGKDISSLFKTNNSISNPSNFVNSNFASLINQNLLAPKNIKNKVFQELNKVYQENIPAVFIGNEKIYLYIRKKYNPPKLDYSYFDNRKKFIKTIVLNRIKQPNLEKVSLSGFINFLRQQIGK